MTYGTKKTAPRFRSPGGPQRLFSVFSAVRSLFVLPHRKRSAIEVYLHRLAAMAHWKGIAAITT
jgi:putative transposase